MNMILSILADIFYSENHDLPRMPVKPNPNPTPPNIAISGLHDTAAMLKMEKAVT